MKERVLFYGVVQDRDRLAVIGYGLDVRPVGRPVKRFEMGTTQFLEAQAFADCMTERLPS